MMYNFFILYVTGFAMLGLLLFFEGLFVFLFILSIRDIGL